MASLIVKAIIALLSVQPEPVYVAKEIRTRKKFENNVRTDETIGFVYVAVNTGTYDTVSVFVEQKKPIMSPEKLMELNEQGEHVFIEFDNAVLKPYYSERTKSIEDSIKADAVHIVETK